MEIHAPDHPVHSFREFAIHIGIVTIGILIALSLEGIRESIHEHRLVHEARENFRRELGIDRDHIQQELSVVRRISNKLQRTIPQLSALAKQPGAINQELAKSRNSGYFFFLNSWQTALSTGALAHMSSEEVLQYAAAEYDIRYYSNLQTQTLAAQGNAIAFFLSHPNPNPEELKQGLEKLMLFSQAEESLSYVGDQLQGAINAAYERTK